MKNFLEELTKEYNFDVKGPDISTRMENIAYATLTKWKIDQDISLRVAQKVYQNKEEVSKMALIINDRYENLKSILDARFHHQSLTSYKDTRKNR